MVRSDTPSSDYQDTVRSWLSDSQRYIDAGDYNKALELLMVAKKNLSKQPDDNRINAATIDNSLGEVFYLLGNYHQAEQLFHSALTTREQLLGIKHPDTAKTYDNLASVSQAMGKYKTALEYSGKALELRE